MVFVKNDKENKTYNNIKISEMKWILRENASVSTIYMGPPNCKNI